MSALTVGDTLDKTAAWLRERHIRFRMSDDVGRPFVVPPRGGDAVVQWPITVSVGEPIESHDLFISIRDIVMMEFGSDGRMVRRRCWRGLTGP